MRRFYSETLPEAGAQLRLGGDEAHHAVKVLRLGAGDPVQLLDGRGTIAEAVVTAVERERRELLLACRIVSRRCCPPPRRPVRLLVAPPRAKLMGQIVRQATELGVCRLTPVLCGFSVARPDAEGGGLAHWREEALAALKQSGNPYLPVLDEPVSFAEAVAGETAPGLFGAPPDPRGTFTGTLPAEGPSLPLWVGPEGGFTEEETARLLAAGHRPLAIGSWILRIETAVAALLGFLQGMAVSEAAGTGAHGSPPPPAQGGGAAC